MASDRLFEMLAGAKSLPSHELRAVQSAGEAGGDILGGYMQGKDIHQKLAQYKMMNTRLGDIFPPDQIPGNLGPDHTVSDLKQLVDILPYTRSPVADAIGNELSGNQGKPSAPAPVAAPNAPVDPNQIMDTSGIDALRDNRPIPGANNPAPPPGSTALAGIQGVGGGGGANLPAGTSPTVGGGTPFKGMSYMDLQRYGPFLNDIRQGRQFQQSQAQGRELAQLSRDQTERNFQISQANEQGRARAGVAEKNAPNLTAVGQLETALTAMDKLNSAPGNVSIPFTGNLGARYAKNVPNTSSTWALNQKAAEGWAGVGAGAIEKLVEGRYNDDQMIRIQDALFPTGNELGTRVGNIKIQQLRSYVEKAKSGGISQVLDSLDSIAGGTPNMTALTNPTPNIKTPAELQGNALSNSPNSRYQIGQVVQGRTGKYIYKGGNESDPNSFQKIQ